MSIRILSGLYSLNFRVFEFNYFYLVVYTFCLILRSLPYKEKLFGGGLVLVSYSCFTCVVLTALCNTNTKT